MKKPQVFGKYLLLERMNVGGMAEVFVAKSFGVEGFERILAIKKILPTMAEDEEFITMFIDEARISVQLNHANIVHIYELGKFEGTFYIAMEYVSGKDLRSLLETYKRRREIMPTAQAVFIAARLAEGLDYAHHRKDMRGVPMGIIHRDVTPQNVLLSFEGEVKIIDFGIAKAANRSQHTQAGILKGKFGYMSPEQVLGLTLDGRSDIFALGVILYEMLAGERLFLGDSDFSTLERIRSQPVPPPRQFNPSIPQGLETVMLKALARDPAERYQTGADFQEDLMRFLLAGDTLYAARHLSTCMRDSFADDVRLEAERMARFVAVPRPAGIENTGMLGGLDRPPAAPGPWTGPELPEPRDERDITGKHQMSPDSTQVVEADSLGQREITDVKAAPSERDLPFDTEDSAAPDTDPGVKPKVVIGQRSAMDGATVVGPAPKKQEPVDPLAAPVTDNPTGGAVLSESTRILAKPTSRPDIPDPLPPPVDGPPGAEAAPGINPQTEPGLPAFKARPATGASTEVPMLSPSPLKRIRPPVKPKGGPRRSSGARAVAATFLLVLLLAGVLGSVVVYRQKRARGNVLVIAVPERLVSLTLGGQWVRNGEVNELPPGEYELVVSAPGYLTHRERVKVAAGHTAAKEVVLSKRPAVGGVSVTDGGVVAADPGHPASVLTPAPAPVPTPASVGPRDAGLR